MMTSSRFLSIVVKIPTLILAFPTTTTAQAPIFNPDVGCSICGDGLRVTNPETLWIFLNLPIIPCGELEEDGFNGKIPLDECLFYPQFVSQVCGCSSEPRAPSTSAAPTISVAPSDTPTSTTAPSATPSFRPSNFPTITSSPTDDPGPGCSICGDGLRVREPDAIFMFPGIPDVSCRMLEEDGFNGRIELDQCPFLPPLIPVCDCGELQAPSVSAAPTISLAPSDRPTSTTAPSATPSFRPSNFPTTTSSPTDEGESNGGPYGICFSKHNKVLSKDKGLIAISELTIGDYILTAGNNYELVYSLAHNAPTKEATFIRVATTAQTDDDGPLEISPNHMVFTGEGEPIMAKSLQIGDFVLLPNGKNTEIISIDWVWSEGLFAPFTTSGTLVVNGIVSSSYVEVTHVPWVSGHWLANVFQIPHRTICTWHLDWCKHETYSEEGLSRWVSAPANFLQWVSRQHAVFRVAMHAMVVTILCFLGIVTEVYGYFCGCLADGGLLHWCCFTAVAGIGAFVVVLRNGRGRWVVNLNASFVGGKKTKTM